MKKLHLEKVVMLALLGLGLAACGGAERNELPQPRPDVQEGRVGRLVFGDANAQEAAAPGGQRSAMGTTTISIYRICAQFPEGYGCEYVEGYPDTYYDWNGGPVDVWTEEHYTDGAYYASYEGTALTYDGPSFEPLFTDGVYTGARRKVIIPNVTSGTFSVTVGPTFATDTLYIW